MKKHSLENCPDCEVKAGQPHQDSCDVESCSCCGEQRLSCDCPNKKHDPLFARWTGWWPGALESEALGIDLNEFYRLELHKVFFIKPKK